MPSLRETGYRHARHYLNISEESSQLYSRGGTDAMLGLKLFDQERTHIEAAFGFLKVTSSRLSSDGADKIAVALLISLIDAVVHTSNLRFHPRHRILWLKAQWRAARIIMDRAQEGIALNNLGTTYRSLGKVQKAIRLHRRSLKIARELGSAGGEADVLGNLGTAYFALGETKKSIEFQELALIINDMIGNQRGKGVSLGNLGNVYDVLGETQKAIGFHQDALRIARETGDIEAEGRALGNLGLAYEDLGDRQRNLAFFEQALALARETGDVSSEGRHLYNSARAWCELGNQEEAIARAEAALRIFETIESPRTAIVRAQLVGWRTNSSSRQTTVQMSKLQN